MSEVYLYPRPAASVPLSLACSLVRLVRVNDSCDAEVSAPLAFLSTSARVYCVNCEVGQVVWTCGLPNSGFRRLWVCGEGVWVADGAGTVVVISPPTQHSVTHRFNLPVLCVFRYVDRLYVVLQDGTVLQHQEPAWVVPSPPAFWQQVIQDHSKQLRQVLSQSSHLLLVTDSEVVLVREKDCLKYRAEGGIVHAALRGEAGIKVVLLTQDKSAQSLQEISVSGEAWVTVRSDRLTGASLIKLLASDYVLEYANASICLSRLSQSESISQLKRLIASGEYREAEPVLLALGEKAVPLLRSFFESASKVQEVTALLKLTKLLPLATITVLCEDLLANPPDDVDCTVNLFRGAQKLIAEVNSRVSLEPLRTKLAGLVRKAETFRLVKGSLREGFADFVRSDLQEEVREFLTRGKLREALCLLRRHLDSLFAETVPLLQYLPDKFDMRQVLDWLRAEVVPLLSEDQLGQLEVWIDQRARGLSTVDVGLAYELANVVIRSRESELITGASGFAVVKQHKQLPDLSALQCQLKSLLLLRTAYKLKLSFAEYERLSPEDIAEMMLKRIGSDVQADEELKTHFFPFVQSQGWKSDTILLNFFLKRPDLPDSTLLALVQAIEDEESRSKAVECLLERASYPLSSELRSLLSLCPRTHKSSQVLYTDIIEVGQKLGLPQLNPEDRYQMMGLLDVLAVRPECTLLAGKLARMLELEPDYIFRRQVFSYINDGTPGKITLPTDLSIRHKFTVLRDAFRYSLSLLSHQPQSPPQERKLPPMQADVYHKGLCAVEVVGQELAGLMDEERYEEMVKVPVKAVQYLKRLARDYKLYLTFEEWNSRKVTASVLTAMSTVQKETDNPLKRKRPAESLAPKKRSKVQLAHLHMLLARPQPLLTCPELSSLQQFASDLLQTLAARPSPAALQSLTQSLTSSLISVPAAALPKLIHVHLHCSLVEHVAKVTGMVGRPFKSEVMEYYRASGRFLFYDEAVSISQKEFAQFVRTVADAVKTNCTRDMLEMARSNNAAVALLPFLSSMPAAEGKAMVESLVRDVLRARSIDTALALSLLLMLPSAHSFDLLSKAANSPDNSLEISHCIAGLAVALASLTRVSDLRSQWLLREANITWQHQLTQFAVPFDPATFSQTPDAGKLCDLIPALLAKSQNYDLVLDFCRSYSLPETEAVSAFVEQQLLIPKVKPEFAPHLNDKPEVLAELLTSSPFETDYQGTVRAVLCSLPKDSMMPILSKCLQRISQVDYERVLFVFTLLLETGIFTHYAKRKQMIDLLLEFRRGVPPSQAEETAMRDFVRYYPQELVNLCEAMYLVRVPLDFLFTSPKETLAREVNVKTLEQLLPVTALYKCDPDYIRITAVNNEMLAHQHYQRNSPCPSCPSLSALKSVIAKLRNFSDKYDLAVKVARFFPVSSEHVGAANFCRVTAGLWLESVPEGTEQRSVVQGYVRDCDKLARQAALQFELKEYGLLPDFGHLTGSPAELVSQLLFQLAPRLVTGDSPVSEEDLWSVVVALAKRGELQLDELMTRLVKDWVAVPRPPTDRAYSLRTSEDSEATETRLLLLSRHWDLVAVISALLKFVEADSGVTLRQKTEALGMLLKICPRSELEKMLPKEKLLGAGVSEYFQHCFYMVDLEEMRIPYRMETLLRCDKASFVRSLLVSYSSEPRVVQLAACLVCDFSVQDSDLHASLMSLLVAQRDFQVVCGFLHTLALRGALTKLAGSVVDTLIAFVNEVKSGSTKEQSGAQLMAVAAIVERLDAPSDKLESLIRLLLDGFFPMELMEPLIITCVRLILLVPDPDTLHALSKAFAERFARSYPLLVVRAVYSYVGDGGHPLMKESYFKVEEEGDYKPLLQDTDLMQQLCTFLIKNDHCKRLLQLAKQQLGRGALADISNRSSQDAVIREVVMRLQRSSS